MGNDGQVCGTYYKTCNICKELKPASSFSKMRDANDGLQYRCKVCSQQYLKDNAEHFKELHHKAYLSRKAADPEAKKRNYVKLVADFKNALATGEFSVDQSIIDKLESRLKTENKVCRACGFEKPLTEFYVRIIHGKHIKVGSKCKSCYNKAAVLGHRNYSANRALYRHRTRALQKGLDFELTVEFIKKSFASECTYCGENSILITIDRKDSLKGYLVDNCVPSCIRCNLIKADMPPDAWNIVAPGMRKARELGLFGDWQGRRNFAKRDDIRIVNKKIKP